MVIAEYLRSGLSSIWAHKVRALLTMLGVLIGVAAIVGSICIGRSGEQRVLDEIQKISSSNLIWMFHDWQRAQEKLVRNQEVRKITVADLLHLRRYCTLAEHVSTEHRELQKAVWRDKVKECLVSQCDREYFSIFRFQLAVGRFFTDHDEQAFLKVCVLGDEVRQALFGSQNPLGQIVTAGDDRFVVVGALRKRGLFFQAANDVDRCLFVPLSSTLLRAPGETDIGVIFVSGRRTEELDDLQHEIRMLLRGRGWDPTDIAMFSLQSMVDGFRKASNVFAVVIGLVASISLFIGGLGIMNMMLVTVRERTREIGVRKALGATNAHIRWQFFVEAGVFSGIGGLLGAAFGVLVTWLTTRFQDWPCVLSGPTLLGAIAFAVALGLIFGLYPAHKAAGLDPAEALRYE